MTGTTSIKVKIIEQNGPQLQRLLTRSDPWAGGECNRDNCAICTQDWDSKPNCRQTNTTYRTICQLCKSQGARTTYIGESSRSLFERMGEHREDAKSGLEGSHIASHLQTAHPGEWSDLGAGQDGLKHFRVELVKTHQTSFRRQLHEACTIMRE